MRQTPNPIPIDLDVDDRRKVSREEPEERRDQNRRRTMLSGTVLFPGEETGRAVTIVNRSEGGAKLRFGDAGLLPQTFTLLDQRAGLAHACRVMWRSMPHVGVHFEKTIDLNMDDQKLTRQLKSLWEQTKG